VTHVPRTRAAKPAEDAAEPELKRRRLVEMGALITRALTAAGLRK
jgi:hypothetical protein